MLEKNYLFIRTFFEIINLKKVSWEKFYIEYFEKVYYY